MERFPLQQLGVVLILFFIHVKVIWNTRDISICQEILRQENLPPDWRRQWLFKLELPTIKMIRGWTDWLTDWLLTPLRVFHKHAEWVIWVTLWVRVRVTAQHPPHPGESRQPCLTVHSGNHGDGAQCRDDSGGHVVVSWVCGWEGLGLGVGILFL